MDLNIVDKNGNVTVDAKTIDASVDGYENQEVIKCPNLYGLDNSALGVSSDYETMEDLTKGLLTNWNFENGTADWTKSTNATFSVTDGIASLGGDGNDDYIEKAFTLTAGRTYVFVIRGKNNNGYPNYFQQGSAEEILPFTTEYSYVRFAVTIGSTKTSFGIKIGPVQPDGYDRTGTILNLDTVSVFDVTDLKSKAIYSPEYNDTFDNITNDNMIAYQLQILTAGEDFYGTPSDYVSDSYEDFKTAANGTGSALLNGRYYFNYDDDVIHDLLAIYGAGNEPSLAMHETLIPQYTNTVIKAKAFENTLQQEYMQLSLDTPVYEGLSLRDIFEDGNIITNPQFENGITGWNDSGIITKSVTNGIIEIISESNISGIFQSLNINGVKLYHNIRYKSSTAPFLTISTPYREINYMIATDFSVYSSIINTTPNTNFNFFLRNRLSTQILYIDYVYALNLTDLFTTAPTQNQLDEWLDIYLTLTSANSKTGTAFVQDRFYIDYDNAKAYDYNIIAPYVTETPADIQAFMEDVLDKTITLTSIPEKMWIEKDRVVILGSYTVIGE